MQFLPRRFRCVLVGGGTLLLQCAEMLLERAHEIGTIVSSDARVRRWAESRGIPHAGTAEALRATHAQEPFEYLFCLGNPPGLSAEVLRLPTRSSIRYQDAPPPRYAGSNATTWALMNQEVEYGVTWHVMADPLDAGEVLKFQRVSIAPRETAHTLNLKCYEAAIHSFAALADDLGRGEAIARQHDPGNRTHFRSCNRPEALCVLRWENSAEEIDAFVRALQFGPYPNPLGLPKLALGHSYFVVSETHVGEPTQSPVPGTVTRIGADSFAVSTSSRELVIRRLLTLEGRPLTIPGLVAQRGLAIGCRLPDLDPEIAARLTSVDERLCEHESFWVERLSRLDPITVPYARLQPEPQDPDHGRHELVSVIPDEFPPRRSGPSAPASFVEATLAAFGAYLARIAQTSRFDIGYMVNIQEEPPGFDPLFARQVPLRIDLQDGWGFEQIAGFVQEQISSITVRQSYARDVVVRYAQIPRASPFQVTVAPGAGAPPGGRALSDSALTLIVDADQRICHWVYDSKSYSKDDISRMSDQFEAFLRGVIADPVQAYTELPLLGQAERRRLTAEGQDDALPGLCHQCVHHWFEEQAARTPDAPALAFGEQSLSYRELNERANRLAHHLGTLGVGPETLVGVCVERSLEMVVGLLGVLKAGAAYVPLDPSYPEERLAFMLCDASPPVIVTQSGIADRLSDHPARIVRLDVDWYRIATDHPGENPSMPVTGDNLAYLIYTSGSTGKPKGILVEHRGLPQVVRAQIRAFEIGPESRELQFASFSFDASIVETFTALCAGATLCLAPQRALLPGRDLIRALEELGITVVTLPPSCLAVLPYHDLPLLKTLVVAGESCPQDLARRWAAGRILINAYGPTEATVCATIADSRDGVLPPVIGRPLANTQIYLLDRNLQPVPVGIPGEICIGGDGLARGYLNRPELTAACFISHPFSAKEGARLYRTGDLGRRSPDGTIEYLGRIDRQVKIRGFRIELEEVESALLGHPEVREVAVTAWGKRPEERRLVAYLVAHRAPPPATSELRRFLAAKIPEYMVPSMFMFLEAFPLTPNGKLDRHRLPSPGSRRIEEPPRASPVTELELTLSAIWQDALGPGLAGSGSDFFDLGGDSLLLVRIHWRIEKVLGRELSIVDLLEHPTARSLAAFLAAGIGTSSRR